MELVQKYSAANSYFCYSAAHMHAMSTRLPH